MACDNFSVEKIFELFLYCPETGVVTWRKGPTNRVRAGSVAGGLDSEGYRQIKFGGVDYPAHRIAWALMTGAWPVGMIDHRDGNKDNNRFLNMRDTTNAINQQNQRKAPKNSSTGLLGVHRIQLKSGAFRWKAQIKVDMRKIPLGTYEDPMTAHQAYLVAKRAWHLGCTI